MIKKEMLSPCIVCNEDDTVLEVSKILRDTYSRHLIVCDKNKKPLGIISNTDIINRCVACEKDVSKTLAKDIMTKEIKTIKFESNQDEIEDFISETDPHSLPVTKDGKLIGIVEIWKIITEIAKLEKK